MLFHLQPTQNERTLDCQQLAIMVIYWQAHSNDAPNKLGGGYGVQTQELQFHPPRGYRLHRKENQ
jgi:hypothetical protein